MAKHVRKKETPLIDMGSIVQYVVMTIIFALLIFGDKYVVLWAVHQSPTGQCGIRERHLIYLQINLI